jgi:hypothetical protein
VLVSAYWKPVYKYIRLHWNKENEDAQDLTQDFFARLLEKQLLDRFDPGRARLRTYLRVCIDGLVMNTDKSSQRLKRGGEIAFLALDFESAEGELSKTQVSPPGNPEEMFAHEFARSLSDSPWTGCAGSVKQVGRKRIFACLSCTTLRKREKSCHTNRLPSASGSKSRMSRIIWRSRAGNSGESCSKNYVP